MSKLPVYALSRCPHCGQRRQGTRGKPGGDTRCMGCGVRRRVPVDRPIDGPDDFSAVFPAAGRPFGPGNEWRVRPGEQLALGNKGSRDRKKKTPADPASALPPLRPYRACDACQESGMRDTQGLWPAAVTVLDVWTDGRRDGRYSVCGRHRAELLKLCGLPDVHIEEKRP